MVVSYVQPVMRVAVYHRMRSLALILTQIHLLLYGLERIPIQRGFIFNPINKLLTTKSQVIMVSVLESLIAQHTKMRDREREIGRTYDTLVLRESRILIWDSGRTSTEGTTWPSLLWKPFCDDIWDVEIEPKQVKALFRAYDSFTDQICDDKGRYRQRSEVCYRLFSDLNIVLLTNKLHSKYDRD